MALDAQDFLAPVKAAVSVVFTLYAPTIENALEALRLSFSRATPT